MLKKNLNMGTKMKAKERKTSTVIERRSKRSNETLIFGRRGSIGKKIAFGSGKILANWMIKLRLNCCLFRLKIFRPMNWCKSWFSFQNCVIPKCHWRMSCRTVLLTCKKSLKDNGSNVLCDYSIKTNFILGAMYDQREISPLNVFLHYSVRNLSTIRKNLD